MIQQMIIEYLTAPEVKEKVLQSLNDNINVPLITEETEAKILSAIWESFSDVLVQVINGK